nr:O-antigen ligase family protein [Solirubrobacterales bacterium]
APAIAIAAAAAYAAELLATEDPTSAAATAQGHDVAGVVAVCALGAALARLTLLPLDRWMSRLELPAVLRRPAVRWGAGVVVVAAIAVAALTLGAPGAVEREYDRFVAGDDISSSGPDVRSRLTDPGNNGRIETWRVALDAFGREPLHGTGAGTYALEWDRQRPQAYQIEDGHSLYAEVLGELGIAGLVLTAAAILLILGGFARRARGPDRVVGGALFAAGVAWALHAGIDWDWEMPVVTAWFFAAGGLASSAVATAKARRRARWIGRAAGAFVCVVLALLPARAFLSDGPLRASARAFVKGDCVTAVDRALDAREALGIRPEPYILLGYCDLRLSRPQLALRVMNDAVRRDPGNWEGHYALAIAQAAAGRDPRPELGRAQKLNPREVLVVQTRRLLGSEPRSWPRLVERVRLPAD